MRTISMLLTFLFIAVVSISTANAQDMNAQVYNTKSYKLLIPKLSVVIDSALANNGMINYRKLEIEVNESNLKSIRREWTNNFGLVADTRYGTFDNFSSNNTETNVSTVSSYSKQLNYTVGLYLKIPVFDVLNRKSKIKQSKKQLAQAKSLVKSQEDELKETVIRYYEELILSQNLMELQAENLGNARVNMEMVEKEFRNGLIPISEYVRISDMTSRIASEYEKAKSNLLVSKKLLENISGININ